MEVYRELEIDVQPEATPQFIKKLEESLSDGWVRDYKSEELTHEKWGQEFFFFACSEKNWRKSARLGISRNKSGKLYVSGIRPSKHLNLSHNEYHQILEEFFAKFVAPVAQEMKIETSMTSREQYLEDWISQEAASKLRSFSDLANRSVPHPLDQRRWYDFLVTVFPDHREFSADRLERWLTESDEWPEEEARELALQYEFAMGLLKYQAEMEIKANMQT